MSTVKLAFCPAKIDTIQPTPTQKYVGNTILHADLSHGSDNDLELWLDLTP